MRTQEDYAYASASNLMADFMGALNSPYREVGGHAVPWAEFVEAFREWSGRHFTRAEIKTALAFARPKIVVGRYSRNQFYVGNVAKGIEDHQWFRLVDGYLVLGGKTFKVKPRVPIAPRLDERLTAFIAEHYIMDAGSTDYKVFAKKLFKYLGLKKPWNAKQLDKQLKLAGFSLLEDRILGLSLREDTQCPSINSSNNAVPESELASSAISCTPCVSMESTGPGAEPSPSLRS